MEQSVLQTLGGELQILIKGHEQAKYYPFFNLIIHGKRQY